MFVQGTFYPPAEWSWKLISPYRQCVSPNPFTGELVTFLTCGIALKISNYSADKSTMSRDFPFGRAEAARTRPFVRFSPSRCLFRAERDGGGVFPSRVSIGRDRRNLISMKRALGDFIRATSYPTLSPVAAGEVFPRSIIPRTSPELLRRLSVDQPNPQPSIINLDLVKVSENGKTKRRCYIAIKIYKLNCNTDFW